MINGSTSANDLPGAPRRARITPWGLAGARFAGRRDGPTAEPGADGYFDYTRFTAARTRLSEAAVGRVLARVVGGVDERIAAARAEAEALRRRTANSPAGGEVPVERPATPQQVRALRTALRQRSTGEGDVRRIADLEGAVEQLLVRRASAHRSARSLLATHVARHDALCAAHLRGWRTRRPAEGRDRDEPTRPPRYEPREGWVTADLSPPVPVPVDDRTAEPTGHGV